MKVFGYAEACELLKTGQTVSYHAGDDGDLELGLVHNYEVKTTGNQSGTTNITINGKTHALSNNTVIDHATWINGKQLEWARYVPLADIGADNNGKLFWTDAANGEDIWSFVSQANANSLGGYTDWRVSNYNELQSLIDLGQTDPCIEVVAFPSTPADSCWMSSTRKDNITLAYYVNFRHGTLNVISKTATKYYCRLVRS